MSQSQVIQAVERPARGKSGARAVRREGRVPGIIYGGDKADQQPIGVDGHAVTRQHLPAERLEFLSHVLGVGQIAAVHGEATTVTR